MNHGVLKVSVYLGSAGTAVSPGPGGVVVVVLGVVVVVAVVVVVVLSRDLRVLRVALAVALQVASLVSVVLASPWVSAAVSELVLPQQLRG